MKKVEDVASREIAKSAVEVEKAAKNSVAVVSRFASHRKGRHMEQHKNSATAVAAAAKPAMATEAKTDKAAQAREIAEAEAAGAIAVRSE